MNTSPSTSLHLALASLESARSYTLSLLEDIDSDDWFRMPQGAPTHLAWQIGHLAMAEYGLALFRQRGRQPLDLDLMSSSFRKLFSKGSLPEANPSVYPSMEEIHQTLARVHKQVLAEAPGFSESQLAESVEMPYFGSPTRLGALVFCSHHEMIHAGQIGLLRRLLGKNPVR